MTCDCHSGGGQDEAAMLLHVFYLREEKMGQSLGRGWLGWRRSHSETRGLELTDIANYKWSGIDRENMLFKKKGEKRAFCR